MKKILLIIAFAAAGHTVFALQESWTSVGVGFNNYFDAGSEYPTNYFAGPGIGMNAYLFKNRSNVGLFCSVTMDFPILEVSHRENSDYILAWQGVVGPGWRIPAGGRGAVRFAAGFAWLMSVGDFYSGDIRNSLSHAGMGIGIDAGYKLDIDERYYIDFGVTCAMAFFAASTINAYSDDNKVRTTVYDGFTRNQTLSAVRPYIGFGWNYYAEEPKPGKPPKE